MRVELPARTLIETARHGAFEPWWHDYTDADRDRAAHLGDRLGLTRQLDQPIGTLSAGERRRVSIARALMPEPDLLLLDEPMANLDLAAREWLIRDIGRLAADPNLPAIVLVSHHLDEIPVGFSHGIVLKDGQIVEAGTLAGVLTDDVLSRAYGLPLRVGENDGRWSARLRG